MEHLKYFWLIVLLGGTIIGFILALTNIYIPKSFRKSIDGKRVLEEKHRYGISFYMSYPIAVCIISAISFIICWYPDVIAKIGQRYLMYFLAILILLLCCIVYVIATCAIMISIEAMISYLIKARYKKRGIKVIKDKKYFNVEE